MSSAATPRQGFPPRTPVRENSLPNGKLSSTSSSSMDSPGRQELRPPGISLKKPDTDADSSSDTPQQQPQQPVQSKPFKGSKEATFYIDVGYVGLLLLTLGPLLLSYLFDGWWGSICYIILASCYLSMKFTDKERKERRLANIILADPAKLKEVVDAKVLKHVMEYLPGYLRNTDMESCQWANVAGSAVFPYVAAFEAHKMKIKINDRLAQMKGIADVSIDTLDAGDISPFGTGVKVYPYQHDKRVVIDADIVWNGKPNVLIKVRIGGQGFDIEVYEVTLNAKMRFIIGPLCVAATPAKAMGISFRQTPSISFGMRIGGVDVMHLGSGPAQVCKIVDNIMKRVINEVFLYPNVSWSALDKTYDIKQLQTLDRPRGLLSINIVSARDLIIADVSSSDPYVKLALGIEERTTKTINRNLNPVWNEHHVMIVYNLDIQVLELNVFDSDTFGADDPIGRVSIRLADLEFYRKEERDLRLEGVPHGTLQIDLMYIPLECGTSDNSVATSPMINNRIRTASSAAFTAAAVNSLDDAEGTDDYFDDAATETASVVNANSGGNSSSAMTPRSAERKQEQKRKSLGLKSKVRAVGRFMIRNRSTRAVSIPHSAAFGVIVFDMISCSNLPAKAMECEPFVLFKMHDLHGNDGDEPGAGTAVAGSAAQLRRMTEIAHGTNCPHFSRTVTFIVPIDQKDHLIKIKVKDNGQKQKLLGEALFSIAEVTAVGLLDKRLKISPQREEVEVRFRAMWCQPTLQPRVMPIPRPDLGALPVVNW